MQTTELIQASPAPFQAIAPATGTPPKPYRERLLRLSDVRFLTGLGRSSIYAAIADGTFPSAVNVTDYAVAWRESEIDAWIAARTKIAAAPTETAEAKTATGTASTTASRSGRRKTLPTTKKTAKAAGKAQLSRS